MRRSLLFVLPVALLLLAAWPSTQAQQAPKPVAGRYAPQPAGTSADWVASLDTWTGKVHITAWGEEPAGTAWVIDVSKGTLIEQPLAKDVSAGRFLKHGLIGGRGAGRSVFVWHAVGSRLGVLDTRTNAHYAVVGEFGPRIKIVRTDLRLLSRSARTVKTKQ